jgi:hypothetical protein
MVLRTGQIRQSERRDHSGRIITLVIAWAAAVLAAMLGL